MTLKLKFVYLCYSINAIIISFIIIGFVISLQSLSNTFFINNGLSYPIPWHLSVEGLLQSLHWKCLMYELVNVFLIKKEPIHTKTTSILYLFFVYI